jgi:hypothetical protein
MPHKLRKIGKHEVQEHKATGESVNTVMLEVKATEK